MQNATFNAVFESTNTTSAAEQNVAKTFSTKLPNGNKLTINSASDEVKVMTAPISELPKDEQAEAQAKLREAMIQNTIESDEAEVAAKVETMAEAPVVQQQYVTPEKWEFTVAEDDDKIEAKGRQAYVWYFKAHQRRTAVASLQMCRVVYEANKCLTDYEFDEFCKNIGYVPKSSTIRKFLVIGKVYPRLIKYADQLPAAWTSIYALTQMPADDFERCIEDGYPLCDLSTSEIDAMVKRTRSVANLMSPFKRDKKDNSFCVARVFFTKEMDDVDLRLLQKAFDEIGARLPVVLRIEKKVEDMHKERALQRYEALKQEAPDAAVKPADWDYGTAANSVYAQKAA
jgi:hypothetical protein